MSVQFWENISQVFWVNYLPQCTDELSSRSWVELVVYKKIQSFLSSLHKTAKSFSKFHYSHSLNFQVALNLLVNSQLNSSLRHIIDYISQIKETMLLMQFSWMILDLIIDDSYDNFLVQDLIFTRFSIWALDTVIFEPPALLQKWRIFVGIQ